MATTGQVTELLHQSNGIQVRRLGYGYVKLTQSDAGKTSGQFNLIGYSYGSLVAARLRTNTPSLEALLTTSY